MVTAANGCRVYYEQHGEGKDILLLHGWGGKCESWAPVLRDMAGSFRLTVLDFPGQGGRSDDPPEPWDVTEYMKMTRELLDQLNIRKTHVVGHSFGGRVALILAATYPELVDRMVLTGVPALKSEPTAEQKLRSEKYKKLKHLADNNVTRTIFGDSIVDRMRSKLQEKFGSADYRALSPEMRKTFSRVVNQDLSQYLPQIHSSTVLFWGSEDTAAPLWIAQKMEQIMEDAGLIVMKGYGHFVYLDRYIDFQAVLKNFLT